MRIFYKKGFFTYIIDSPKDLEQNARKKQSAGINEISNSAEKLKTMSSEMENAIKHFKI